MREYEKRILERNKEADRGRRALLVMSRYT
jgi:hypothetical protein